MADRRGRALPRPSLPECRLRLPLGTTVSQSRDDGVKRRIAQTDRQPGLPVRSVDGVSVRMIFEN